MKTAFLLFLAALGAGLGEGAAFAQLRQSHAQLRPLPQARKEALASGPKRFVDANRGDDAHEGSEDLPWQTLGHAFRQLKPGDTLYLRDGVFYEKPALTRSGTAV